MLRDCRKSAKTRNVPSRTSRLPQPSWYVYSESNQLLTLELHTQSLGGRTILEHDCGEKETGKFCGGCREITWRVQILLDGQDIVPNIHNPQISPTDSKYSFKLTMGYRLRASRRKLPKRSLSPRAESSALRWVSCPWLGSVRRYR